MNDEAQATDGRCCASRTTASSAQNQILIIKHGALGDIILCTGPMQAIRAAHPDAKITLLTAKPYDKLLAECPFVDKIWTDSRPKLWNIRRFCSLIKQLRSTQWDWVYDLQTSQRSTSYFRFLKTQHYSGLHPKGSHPHNTPERTSLHTIDRQKQQLEIAGIADVPAANIEWLQEDNPLVLVSDKLALLVPGGSAHRPEKRWPAENYAALAKQFLEQGYTPALIGTKAEEKILQTISAADERIINLCNKTSFAQVSSLARLAVCAIGNDTGPMHIIAATGCPSTVLFNSTASNPALCAPRGEHITVMQNDDLNEISADNVFQALHISD